MIRHLTAGGSGEFSRVCERDPILGAEISTLLSIYGPDSGMADFWVGSDSSGNPLLALCREGGRVMVAVAGPEADGLVPELRAFLEAVGGWRQLRAEARLCALLAEAEVSTAAAMAYHGPLFGGDYGEIAGDPSTDEIYRLLYGERSGDDRERRGRFAVYASHLFRHGLGFAVGIRRQGRLICTGGVYARGPRQGVIACMATDPACRGQGLASTVARYLCDRVMGEGRVPTLLCAEEQLADFYGALGFRVCGRWGSWER